MNNPSLAKEQNSNFKFKNKDLLGVLCTK